jgi:predicted SAM-dependent methyltransferase
MGQAGIRKVGGIEMATPQLYDDGEERWMKLHVGCGGIYLEGYVNIDAKGTMVCDTRLEVVRGNLRNIENYYGEGTWDNLPRAHNTIVDLLMPMQEIDNYFKEYSVDKIVAIQTLEHLDPIEFVSALDSFYRLLKEGGILIVSVPDMDGTIEWLHDPEKAGFATRHLRGTHKDRWSVHKSWWTEETLSKALSWVGFYDITTLDNIHCYPAIVMKGNRDG